MYNSKPRGHYASAIGKLLFLNAPLLLNDFYLIQLPDSSLALSITLDLFFHVCWLPGSLYLASQAGWFAFSDLGISRSRPLRQCLTALRLFLSTEVIVALLLIFQTLMLHFSSHTATFGAPDQMPDSPSSRYVYEAYRGLCSAILQTITFVALPSLLLRPLSRDNFPPILAAGTLWALGLWSHGGFEIITFFFCGMLYTQSYLRSGQFLPIAGCSLLHSLLVASPLGADLMFWPPAITRAFTGAFLGWQWPI